MEYQELTYVVIVDALNDNARANFLFSARGSASKSTTMDLLPLGENAQRNRKSNNNNSPATTSSKRILRQQQQQQLSIAKDFLVVVVV